MLLNQLNPQQRKAAAQIHGPVLILAGAGSGKTRTITYRIAHMLLEKSIPAEEILGVTFTNKAAKEMQERVNHLVPRQSRRGLTLSTFHSLGIRILKQEIHHLGYKRNFSIYDTSDQTAIIRELMRNYRADKSKYDIKQILSKISYLKNKDLGPDEYLKSDLFDWEEPYDVATHYAYQGYQQRLLFYNAIDFDDILFLTVKLFEKHPEIAQFYSKKYQFIMIDEYQDTNELQFQLVQHLTSCHQNICVVGDDDQGIYSFRGANITNILNFEKQFKSTSVIRLEQNYRSTSSILDLANEVIKRNTHRKEKSLWSDNGAGNKPILWLCQDGDHESLSIVDEVLKLQNKGIPLGEIAILIRGANQLPFIEDQLRANLIPYCVRGGQKFYEKKEIKDIIAYLSVIQNPYNELALRRVINTPHRGIGLTTLKKLLELEEQSGEKLVDLMKTHRFGDKRDQAIRSFLHTMRNSRDNFKNLPLDKALEKLIVDIQFENYIRQSYDNPSQANFRLEDLRHLVLSAKRFEEGTSGKANLGVYLEKILLADNQDRRDDQQQSEGVELTIMTLHSSKGLEFDYVFMAGVEEEILPHKRSIQEDNIPEERRLCYVGITRARKQLYMSYCKEREMYNKKVPRKKSRFLCDVDPFYTEQDRTQFGHLSEQEAEEYKKNFFEDLLSSLD